MTRSVRYSICCFLGVLVGMLSGGGTGAAAQTTLELRGYAKNLGIRSSSILSNEAYLLDISRLRAQGLLGVGGGFHAELWLDTELLLGSFLDTPEFALGQSLERPTFFDLDWKVAEGKRYHLRQQFFRAFATLYLGQTQVTVGRQRIAWGTGFAWNPTDVLNPFNPSAIELGEKAGVDAAYVAIPLGAFSRVEAVVAPGRHRDRTSAALRASTNWREYDVSVMGGLFRDDWVLGGDFAGYLGNAGFRGEVAYTWKQDGRNHLRAVLNADYTFSGGYYVLVEWYYNGQGTRDKGQYDVAALLAGETFNVARDYLAASVARSITPLLSGAAYSLVNLDDQSSLIGPSFTYSLAENLDLLASTYFFIGKSDTEFGAQEHVFFGALQFYF
ncbi:MAG: hypothetical protein ACE5G0_00635 [Rhodothermales bacterium]